MPDPPPWLRAAVSGALVNALGFADFKQKPGGKGGASKGKGKGKGFGNSGQLQPASTSSFQCLFSDCSAAQRKQTTRAGKPSCFMCGRPKASSVNPPVESMVKWHFDAQLAEARAATAAPSSGNGCVNAPKAKAKATPKIASAGVAGGEAAAAIRKERLAALRSAKLAVPPGTAAPSPGIMQAVSDAFNDSATDGRERANLSEENKKRLLDMGALLDEFCASVATEGYPRCGGRPSAAETVKSFFPREHPSGEEVSQAQAQLAAARRALQSWDETGASADDPYTLHDRIGIRAVAV